MHDDRAEIDQETIYKYGDYEIGFMKVVRVPFIAVHKLRKINVIWASVTPNNPLPQLMVPVWYSSLVFIFT